MVKSCNTDFVEGLVGSHKLDLITRTLEDAGLVKDIDVAEVVILIDRGALGLIVVVLGGLNLWSDVKLDVCISNNAVHLVNHNVGQRVAVIGSLKA